MTTAHFPASTAPTLETQPRTIRPLGDQVIIRVIQPGSVGSIIIPDSAKGITMVGTGNPHEAKEATDYLINAGLFEELVHALKEDSRAAKPERQEKWRRELAARLERSRSMPIPSNPGNAIHFVEAEVVAVGPGKRRHDARLLDDCLVLVEAITRKWDAETIQRHATVLFERANRWDRTQPLQVKPGDRILYHPAVQRFDRKIDPVLIGLPDTEECYIISEQTSVLAVLERDE